MVGSAIGLIIIATFHPFIFHKSMVFIPTAIFLFIQIILYLGVLIAEIFAVDGNDQLIFLLRGMIDCPCCFYMYFIIPLKIASHYRHTQEVTPAASVVSVCAVLIYITSSMLYTVITRIVEILIAKGVSTLIADVTPLFLALAAFFIVRSQAYDEWMERKRRKHKLSRTEASMTEDHLDYRG